MNELMVTTYSMWSQFRNCRKACDYRYLQGLSPVSKDANLSFGALIHECLELWHRERDLAKVLDHIDRAYPNRVQDEEQKKNWHLATAMMKGYAACYAEEKFHVIALEKGFKGRIINPSTGGVFPQFYYSGKGGWDSSH